MRLSGKTRRPLTTSARPNCATGSAESVAAIRALSFWKGEMAGTYKCLAVESPAAWSGVTLSDTGTFARFWTHPRVPWKEPALLGSMKLSPSEFLFIEDAVESFCAFLGGRPFPARVHWRDVTAELVAAGVEVP